MREKFCQLRVGRNTIIFRGESPGFHDWLNRAVKNTVGVLAVFESACKKASRVLREIALSISVYTVNIAGLARDREQLIEALNLSTCRVECLAGVRAVGSQGHYRIHCVEFTALALICLWIRSFIIAVF